MSGEAMVRRFSTVWQAKEDEAVGKLKEAGVKVTDVQGALLDDLRKRLAFVEQEWLADATKKTPDAKAALDEYRGLVKSLSSEMGVK